MFKIISTGWNIHPDFIETTLRSIGKQSRDDYHISIAYEATGHDDPAVRQIYNCIDRYLVKSGHVIIRYPEDGYLFDVRNRYEATMAAEPEDDDIIVTLDLDGDSFTHPDVLGRLHDVYSDPSILLTYGSYRPIPFDAGCEQASEYPPEVVAERSYRRFGRVYFNHLRTMKGKVFNAIPVDQFQYSAQSERFGQWYTKGNDVEFTLSGLELVGPRFAVLPDILMDYNSVNPNSAWRIASGEINDCVLDFMARPPLPQTF